MPRIAVKNVSAEAGRAHPREFSLLYQLGGPDALDSEVCGLLSYPLPDAVARLSLIPGRPPSFRN